MGKVGFQRDQIPAASWSVNTHPPSNQLIITLIRLLFDLNGENISIRKRFFHQATFTKD